MTLSGSKAGQWSTGAMNSANNGTFPLLPTSFVIAKDITIPGDGFSKDVREAFNKFTSLHNRNKIHKVATSKCMLKIFLRHSGEPHIPYSGKFSLVQIFVELHVSLSEEIFMVFVPSHIETTPTSIDCTYDITFSSDFAVLIFAVPNLSAKNAKFCTMRKFPAICDLLQEKGLFIIFHKY
jgi:hypothetical protein